MNSKIISRALFLTLVVLAFDLHALTPSQVFDKVKDSVVVVKTLDSKGKTIARGSGVLLPSNKIGTNCHVVKDGARFLVGGGTHFVPATLWGGDEDKDICLLEVKGLTTKAAQLGQAARLKVGDPVYAVGAPQGLELSLSDGIVSQLRGGTPPLIQTTAAISPGSSGGGLFDADGQLVGFTTLYLKGGQSLNFAMPVEWVAEIQAGKKLVQGRSNVDWYKQATAFEDAKNWTGLRDWCQQWTRAQPGNVMAWSFLGQAYGKLQRHNEAIEAELQALRINPEYANAWYNLGGAYISLQRYTDAIDAYRRVVRANPEIFNAWYNLGIAYSKLDRHTEGIEAYRQALRINPKFSDAWNNLALSYHVTGNRSAALEAERKLRYLDAVKADALLNFIRTR